MPTKAKDTDSADPGVDAPLTRAQVEARAEAVAKAQAAEGRKPHVPPGALTEAEAEQRAADVNQAVAAEHDRLAAHAAEVAAEAAKRRAG